MMKTNELIKALRRMQIQTGGLMCMGCGHEHNCGIHGCAVIREAADMLTWFEWLDPEIEVPPDDGAVLGIVNGVIDGIEHQNVVSLVCYDRGEWWMFDRPDIDAKVDWWMPLPEPQEEGTT